MPHAKAEPLAPVTSESGSVCRSRSPQIAPVNEEVASAFPRSWYVVRRDVERRASPLVEEYRTARAARQRLMTGVQWITPAAATYTALVEVAGTGEAWFSAYDAQARRYAQRLHEWLSVPIFRGEKLAVDAIGSVPRFRFEAPGVLGAAPPAAGYLLVLVVVLSLGLRRQLRRFDRRVLRHSPRARRSRRLAAASAGVGTRPQL